MRKSGLNVNCYLPTNKCMNPDVPELSDKSSSVPDSIMPTFQNYEVIFDFLRDHFNILIFELIFKKKFWKRDMRQKP